MVSALSPGITLAQPTLVDINKKSEVHASKWAEAIHFLVRQDAPFLGYQ
jgi:hypothetical protein